MFEIFINVCKLFYIIAHCRTVLFLDFKHNKNDSVILTESPSRINLLHCKGKPMPLPQLETSHGFIKSTMIFQVHASVQFIPCFPSRQLMYVMKVHLSTFQFRRFDPLFIFHIHLVWRVWGNHIVSTIAWVHLDPVNSSLTLQELSSTNPSSSISASSAFQRVPEIWRCALHPPLSEG